MPNSHIRTWIASAAALLAVACAARHPTPAPERLTSLGADSIPKDFWVDIYFRSFDLAASAAGLPILRQTPIASGEREVRIWTQVEIGEPREMYRFVERGGRVTGEMYLHFHYSPADTSMGQRPGETFADLMRSNLAGPCNRILSSKGIGACKVEFAEEPRWSAILRDAEAEGLWTIPDPSALPPDKVMVMDGWTIIVELREGAHYRTYRYNSPSAHPTWAVTKNVMRIAGGLQEIDSKMKPRESVKLYRGVTTGKYASSFRPCSDTVAWEFHDQLSSMAKRSSPAVRSSLPSSITQPGVPDTAVVYTVEVYGELTPEWLARRWESKFSRVLQTASLKSAHVGIDADCRVR